MAMPPGPPQGQGPEQPQMDPQQAQQVLAKFGIKSPEDIQMVMMACEALEGPEAEEGQGEPPPQQVPGGGLMAALGKRYQGGPPAQ